MLKLLKAVRLLTIIILLIPLTLSAADENINLHTERGNLSNDGRIKLIWGAGSDEDVEYEVQSSQDSTFSNVKLIYKGPDRASFISGLKNGTYYFRAREKNEAWSETLTVEVEHHSLRLAIMLFILGGVVFVLTVGVVVEGTMRTKTTSF